LTININGKTICPENYFNVHGRITFSGKLLSFLKIKRVKRKKDNKLYLYNNLMDYWVFGFDTSHYGDNLQKCTEKYVKKEALYLKKQIDKRKFYDKVYLRKMKLNKLINQKI